MRAAILERAGEVAARDWEDPRPGPGEALVRLRRAALNRLDAMVVANPAAAGLELPLVTGGDGAGVVEELGEGAGGVAIGDQVVVNAALRWGPREDAPGPDFSVLCTDRRGTHAELIALPAENLFPRPERLSWEESAALPLAGLTAWRALVNRGGLRAGQTVLVTGAAGGASTSLIQIATALGARVLVTSSSAEKLDAARALGAAEGVDRLDPGWPERIAELSNGGVDVAVDSSGDWRDAAAALRPGGTLVVFGRTAQASPELDARGIYWRQISIHGTTMGSPREMEALLEHVREASWRPVIDSVQPLERVADAFRRLDSGERIGKVVLEVG